MFSVLNISKPYFCSCLIYIFALYTCCDFIITCLSSFQYASEIVTCKLSYVMLFDVSANIIMKGDTVISLYVYAYQSH